MEVEVDLFSGRPNPVFRATLEQAEIVRRTLEQLADAPAESCEVFDGLGYRGFRLSDPVQDCQFRVWREVVVGEEAGTAFSKADPQRRLENICLSIARDCLDADTYRFLQQQAEEDRES